MSFSAAWLDLREPADHAARDRALLAHAADFLARGGAGALALDLGCGTGSTLRAFGALMPPAPRWRLFDRDAALLQTAAARLPGAETVAGDLAQLDAIPLQGVRLVTASALFDLAGRDWIEALADRIAAAGAGVYAALSYDGHMAWDPADPEDAAVTAAFNADQRRDKGLGPALGPEGGAYLAAALAARGYRVRCANSPWRLGPAEVLLHRALIDGIAAAAAPAFPAAAGWGARRLARAEAARATIGHVDVLALPPGT